MSKTFRKNPKTQKIYQDKDRKHQKASRSCLHHGGCPYCENNRFYNTKIKILETDMQIQEIHGRDLLG